MKTQITLQERLRDLQIKKGLKLEELSAQTEGNQPREPDQAGQVL